MNKASGMFVDKEREEALGNRNEKSRIFIQHSISENLPQEYELR